LPCHCPIARINDTFDEVFILDGLAVFALEFWGFGFTVGCYPSCCTSTSKFLDLIICDNILALIDIEIVLP
jgi:hypothetical protein